MTDKVITHEIKLETSLKVILGVLAFGVLAHAFVPAFNAGPAFAANGMQQFKGAQSIRITGPVQLSGKLALTGNLGNKLAGNLAIECKGCAKED